MQAGVCGCARLGGGGMLGAVRHQAEPLALSIVLPPMQLRWKQNTNRSTQGRAA